jgi:hypothetical protein
MCVLPILVTECNIFIFIYLFFEGGAHYIAQVGSELLAYICIFSGGYKALHSGLPIAILLISAS